MRTVRSALGYLAVITAMAVGCRDAMKPSEATVRSDFEKLLAWSNNRHGSISGKFALIDLKKTNAIASIESGVSIYTVEFDVALKCSQSGFPPLGLRPQNLVMEGDV